MLSLIYGPSGYGKTYSIITRINDILDRNEGRKIFVIVPEQESVKMEAELLEFCGNRINADVEVINFTRLANRVFREAGGMTYEYIDKAGKDLLVAVILEKLKSVCPSFARVSNDTGYIQLLRGELDSLRMRGYHAKDLEKAGEILRDRDRGGSSLEEKLSDLTTIFSAYEKALKDNISDTTDDIVRLAETLDDYDFFDNSYVFVDGFYDYTAPQYTVLEKIMKSCYDMTVTFSLSLPDTEELFRKTKLAFDTVREGAEKNGVEYECIEFEENHRTKNPALETLSQAIMTGEELHCDSSEGVTVNSVFTPYEECVFVAREIVKLVKEGASFSQIAVCSSDIASYGSVLENVFDTYGISHLTCKEKSVVQMPITSFVLDALDVINSSFFAKNVRSYLKSPYLDLAEDEGYCLENYVTMWNLGKKNWFSSDSWHFHPRGYVEGYTKYDKEELEKVNSGRNKVFPPLKRLFDGFSDRSTVKEKAEALVDFCRELKLAEKVEDYNKVLSENFGKADYDDEINAWNLFLTALDMLVEGAGDLVVGRDRFIKYLRLILNDMTFGRIPSSLDEVEIGDVEFVRSKNIKHMFFLGFNDGVFPSPGKTASVFTESERGWLMEIGLKVDETTEEKMRDCSFQFLLSVLRPSQSLHFVFHTSSSDSHKATALPSYYYSVINEALGTEISEPDLKLPVAIHELKEYAITSSEDMSSLFEIDEGQALYKEALTLRSFAERSFAPFRLDSDREIFPKEFSLSQSRFERYEKCPFSYFVEYMLNARVRRKAEFGSAEIGSYVHKILETVLKTLSVDGKGITEASREEIEEAARRSAEEYIETTAPNINEDSPKYKYLVDNICSFVLLIVENIKEEFAVSLFKPIRFEESLRNSDIVSPYEVKLRDGGKLIFYGIIDRVDTYIDSDGVEYIRVVDYKTKSGGKSFSLEDVLNGINLQMLIYLYAFTDTPSERLRREAGIMYMPAMRGELTPSDSYPGDEVIRAKIHTDLKRSGMYLDDRHILDAMEMGESKRFIDLKYDKKADEYQSNSKSTLAGLEEFGIIKRYIDMLFNDVVDSIRSGNIEASPIEEENAKGSACSYCKYHPICRYEGEPRERIKCDTPLVKMQEELEQRQ